MFISNFPFCKIWRTLFFGNLCFCYSLCWNMIELQIRIRELAKCFQFLNHPQTLQQVLGIGIEAHVPTKDEEYFVKKLLRKLKRSTEGSGENTCDCRSE